MNGQTGAILRAEGFARHMRGYSKSALVEATDSRLYVVKWHSNRATTPTVFNEVLGTTIYKSLGLPVPEWAPIEVAQSWIDDRPAITLSEDNQLGQPSGGFHFASLYMGQNGEDIYETLPSGWFSCIRKPGVFWGALVADLWLGTRDNRQAIFLRKTPSVEVLPYFIDHDRLLADDAQFSIRQTLGCLHLERRIYQMVDAEEMLDYWVERVRQYGDAALCSAFYKMRPEWLPSESGQIGEILQSRIRHLPEIVSSLSRELRLHLPVLPSRIQFSIQGASPASQFA